jgi:acyl-CoA reductase-like NAD-dependent aldehyde dehydrogenase
MSLDILASAPPREAGMLIGGDRVSVGRRIQVHNPAHPDEVVGSVIRGTPEHMREAIEAAKAAQQPWARQSFRQRAQALSRMLDGLDLAHEERAVLFVRENGKPLADATAELVAAVAQSRQTLALAEILDQQHELPAQAGRTLVRHLPYGVVVAIVPWNSPVVLAALQIVPALLAGNSVVLKVPESCPLVLTWTAEQMAERLPPGLLNIVSGLPEEIGEALTGSPDVAKIAFTGSVPSARRILATAAQSIKSVTAELGGNDAAIVLDDLDLTEQTMDRMAGMVFRMAGQICMAIKRIYVPDRLHDAFLEAFGRSADAIEVGDGLVPGVTMGPLHTRSAQERACRLTADAQRRGATVIPVGKVIEPKTFREGHFVRPTLVTDIGDDAPLVVEEQFSPVIPILRYADVEEAVERANTSIYGLGGSVWGRDEDRALEIAGRLQAGTVFVNTHGTRSINRQAPYGGVKQSGLGRRSGIEGVLEYLQSQTLTTYETG